VNARRNAPDAAEVDAAIGAAELAIGVTLADRSLVRTALTHPSWAAEHDSPTEYERLEFLGDSVLGFLVAEHLFREFPDAPEGTLARLRAEIVSGESLAQAAEQAGIGEAILLGRGAEAEGGRRLASVRADVFEALIGAVYLDAGVEAARGVVTRLVIPFALPRALAGATRDPKGVLQEHTMGTDGALPEYRVVAEDGPAHDRRFTVEVDVDGACVGRGVGVSKKAAEKAAAAAALEALGVLPGQ
jgi:ribonuclease-3